MSSFLNSSGGHLFIGVDDSGVVSGIEGDLPWLNKDDKDKFNGQYSNTTDGYEQKITNAVSSELGELAAEDTAATVDGTESATAKLSTTKTAETESATAKRSTAKKSTAKRTNAQKSTAKTSNKK